MRRVLKRPDASFEAVGAKVASDDGTCAPQIRDDSGAEHDPKPHYRVRATPGASRAP